MWTRRSSSDTLRLFPAPVALGIAVLALLATSLAFAGAPVPTRHPRAVKAADPWAGYARQDLAYFRRLPVGGRLGRITIPAAGAYIDVVKGSGDEQLSKDAGFVVGTDYPGPNGNAAIGAHRTTFQQPFRHIDALKPGDVIVFRSPFREYRYAVTGHAVVSPTDVQVLRYSRSPIVTLISCHPPGVETLRYIVRGKLVSVTPLARR